MKVVFFLSNRTLVRCVIIFLICAILVAVGIFHCSRFIRPDDFGKSEINPDLQAASKGLSWYNIVVMFDPDEAELSCAQTVNYINNHNTAFDRLYFHLYPNAFRDENRVPFFADEKERAYPNGFSPGWIEIESITVNEVPADFQISGYSNNILDISLNSLLKPGDTVKIVMTYRVKIPNCIGRFGYGQHTFNITNWYPIVCVYDHDGWNIDPYYPVGDPFYSDVANYEVIIKAPTDYTVAATGNITDIKYETGYKIWKIQALAVRDFAWLASREFEVVSRNVDGITVYSYFLPGSREGGMKAADYVASAVEIFNRRFGKYPYSQLSVVQSDFFVGGMEYPNLVMVDKSLYAEGQEYWLEYVTVHETAHQWWYGVVGNDQIDEAWLDEALTEYSTILYYGNRYGSDKEKEIYNNVIAEGKCLFLQNYYDKELLPAIDQPVYRFPDWITYDLVVYGKGASIFNDLRHMVGDEVFYRILQEYYESNKFKNATAADLIDACNKVTGKEWRDFFDERLKSIER
jgi:hypothetical protein